MPLNNKPITVPTKQKGFSMIEVLITILVFAVGLLGVASLQTTGIRMVRDGGQIGQASMLASSMADRMRSNAAGDTYIDVSADDDDCKTDVDVDCTLEQEEIFEWNEEIANFLPAGEGIVTTDSGAYVISITWQESEDSNQVDNTRTYSLAVQI